MKVTNETIARCPYTNDLYDCSEYALSISKGPQAPQGPPYTCYSCPIGRDYRWSANVFADDLVESSKFSMWESRPGAADRNFILGEPPSVQSVSIVPIGKKDDARVGFWSGVIVLVASVLMSIFVIELVRFFIT